MLHFGQYRLSNNQSNVDRFNRQLNRMMCSVPSMGHQCREFPSFNLYDNQEAFIVKAELPGMDEKDLEIVATAESLTIKGSRKNDEIPEGANFHRRERDHREFSRSLDFPDQVDPKKIVANYKNGVIEVICPRADRVMPQKVTIN